MEYNLNIEIKARILDIERIRSFIIKEGAVFKGVDHQIDTYFNTSSGRLKIREGTIENCIVQYSRPDQHGPKRCVYTILKYPPDDHNLKTLKKILHDSVGTLVIVEKKRQIFYLENTKFHLDIVKGLGTFLEIEVINDGTLEESELRNICESYIERFGIELTSFESTSYSDMILAENKAVK